MSRAESRSLSFHILFFAISGLLIWLDMGISLGPKILFLVLFYHFGWVFVSLLEKGSNHFFLWKFLFPLSLWLVFPDWFLADKLDVLEFPKVGGTRIGAVPIFMPLMWLIPLSILCQIGQAIERRHRITLGYVGVGIFSLILFSISEEVAPSLPLWYPKNVKTIGQTAMYVPPAEVVLALSTFYAFRHAREWSFGQRLVSNFLLMILYLGSLSFFYFLFG